MTDIDKLFDEAMPLQDFKTLLDDCRKQVEHDPDGYTNNPHLYDIAHKILLRLCHGNIPDFKVDD